LFQAGDAHGLAAKMQQFIAEPALIQRFRENIPPIKGIEENASEIEDIYYNLAKS